MKCGVIWPQYNWLSKFYNFYMVAVVSIISECIQCCFKLKTALFLVPYWYNCLILLITQSCLSVAQATALFLNASIHIWCPCTLHLPLKLKYFVCYLCTTVLNDCWSLSNVLYNASLLLLGRFLWHTAILMPHLQYGP